jgi:hypothetical protein
MTRFCLKCNKRLFSHNTTGYCVDHRGLSEKRKLTARKSRLKNRETKNLASKQYYKDNREKIISRTVNYKRERIKIDPLYKLVGNLRSRLKERVKVSYWRKSSHFNQYIGCDIQELKNHIEKQFADGMNWDNHSYEGWHIDHIIPLSSAKNIEELYKLCHYTNLQPLWAKDNLRKGNRKI